MSFQMATVDFPTAAQAPHRETAPYETAPYKHSGEPEFFSSVVEEFVVWSRPQQLRLAVRAAIAAYEKCGKMLDAALVLRGARLPRLPAHRRQDAGPEARQGRQRQADPRNRVIQEGDDAIRSKSALGGRDTNT